MDHSRELRDAATALAKNTAARDYEGSRNALGDLAVSCNRCHQAWSGGLQDVCRRGDAGNHLSLFSSIDQLINSAHTEAHLF